MLRDELVDVAGRDIERDLVSLGRETLIRRLHIPLSLKICLV
jgi:hypothetical protein